MSITLPAPNVITRQQYHEVEGLIALGRFHNKIVTEVEEALRAIVEPDSEGWGDWTGEALYGDINARQLLKKTNTIIGVPTKKGTTHGAQ